MRKKLPLISGILNVLEKLKGNTGIIENTSVATHTIAAGKYVIWKNDLYKASSAISIGDTLSLSNLTAVSDGIANELNSNMIKYYDFSTPSDQYGTISLPSTTISALPDFHNVISCMLVGTTGFLSRFRMNSDSGPFTAYIVNWDNSALGNTTVSCRLYYE